MDAALNLWSIWLLATPLMAFAASESDPTRPPEIVLKPVTSQKSEASGALVLQSVIFGVDRKIAIINGQPLKLGSSIAGATLVEINPLSVVLRDSNGKHTLTLVAVVKRKAFHDSQQQSEVGMKQQNKPKREGQP